MCGRVSRGVGKENTETVGQAEERCLNNMACMAIALMRARLPDSDSRRGSIEGEGANRVIK